MAEDETDRSRPPLPGMPDIDRELERLRERLGALHASVEGLGREPLPGPPPSPTVAIPAGARVPGEAPSTGQLPAADPEPARGAWPPPPTAPGPPDQAGRSGGAPVFAPPPATPPPPPPRPAPPPAVAQPPAPAPGGPGAGVSAGTGRAEPGPLAEGQRPGARGEDTTAVAASFVVVDAGPIAGLAAARRFEDALAALPAVREVRLRRFSRRRAEIEVGLSAPHALGAELPMLELPAEVETFHRDRLVLRLGGAPAGGGTGS